MGGNRGNGGQEASPPVKTARTRPRTHVPENEIAEVRDVSFPVAMRGYEREAVDAYVSRVNRLIAELQISASPESAIRNALDEVSQETRGILEQAHEAAEGITRRSRSQADDRLQRAEREGEEIRASADAYAREIRETAGKHLHTLEEDADRIWKEREALISDLRERAQQIEQTAASAKERYPERPDLSAREAEKPESGAATKPPPPPPVDDAFDDEDETRDLFADD